MSPKKYKKRKIIKFSGNYLLKIFQRYLSLYRVSVALYETNMKNP